mmetsp:Transcript_107110/g.301442  ORF Transcript_107110/g.301442 Transcript_107110/m.301442 type:complete len:326 (-) Transcript_107110:1-978(-)
MAPRRARDMVGRRLCADGFCVHGPVERPRCAPQRLHVVRADVAARVGSIRQSLAHNRTFGLFRWRQCLPPLAARLQKDQMRLVACRPGRGKGWPPRSPGPCVPASGRRHDGRLHCHTTVPQAACGGHRGHGKPHAGLLHAAVLFIRAAGDAAAPCVLRGGRSCALGFTYSARQLPRGEVAKRPGGPTVADGCLRLHGPEDLRTSGREAKQTHCLRALRRYVALAPEVGPRCSGREAASTFCRSAGCSARPRGLKEMTTPLCRFRTREPSWTSAFHALFVQSRPTSPSQELDLSRSPDVKGDHDPTRVYSRRALYGTGQRPWEMVL